MGKNLFEQSIDQSRLDRLQGEISAFVSDFNESGYSNLEIARALVRVAFKRALDEDYPVHNSFLQFLRDNADQQLKDGKDIVRALTDKRLAKEIN